MLIVDYLVLYMFVIVLLELVIVGYVIVESDFERTTSAEAPGAHTCSALAQAEMD